MRFLAITSLGLILMGCSSGEVNFADKIRDRSTHFDDIAMSWEKGHDMVKDGNKLFSEGQSELNKGRSLMNSAQHKINEAQQMIEQGKSLQLNAESQYRVLRAPGSENINIK